MSNSKTVYPILIAICFAHLINDLLQIVLQTSFPLFKEEYQLSYAQIGVITLTFQLTSSIFQPFVGYYTDKKPQPYSFVLGMLFSLTGIIGLSFATDYWTLLTAAAIIGFGSSIFHPEASKLAYHASGGKRGLAQSIFQIGGNTGTAIGPLLVTLIVLNHTQKNIAYFSILAIIGIGILVYIGKWYTKYLASNVTSKQVAKIPFPLSPNKTRLSFLILLILLFSKYFYSASITNYLQFYLIENFDFTVDKAQKYLFVYLIAVAMGTLIGGPIGDRIGRKYVIWFSILGTAPFTLLLPYANEFWTLILLFSIGIILASAFSAILVYAQELLPGKTGTVSGFFFGFAFGMGGIGAALIGNWADVYGLKTVFSACSFLPLLGILTVFLPNLRNNQK